MKTHCIIFFIFIPISVFSQVENLRIGQALKERKVVKMSKIVSDQSFVDLDYVEGLEVDENIFTYLLKDRIICVSANGIYVFDRKGSLLSSEKLPRTGWWLNYFEFAKVNLLDERQRTLIIPQYINEGWNSYFLREYNIDNLYDSKKLSPIKKQDRDWYIGNLNSGDLLFKRENFDGSNLIELSVCSRDSILYNIENKNHFNQENTTLSLRAGSYRYNNQLFFYEDGDDFVYHIVNKEKRVAYQLGLDDLIMDKDLYLNVVQYVARTTGNRKVKDAVLKKYITSIYITESSNYILFSFSYEGDSYVGCHSKRSHDTVITNSSSNDQLMFCNNIPEKYSLSNLRWYINQDDELCTLLSSKNPKSPEENSFSWKSFFSWFFGGKERKIGKTIMILQLK